MTDGQTGSLTVTDAAGNTSAATAIAAVDASIPTASTIGTSNATTLSGTAEPGATVTIYAADGTTVLATTTADGSGNWSTTNPLTDGQTGSVTVTDAAGNVGPATAIAAVDGSVPTVTLTSNASDPEVGPFTVTATFSESITGFNAAGVIVTNGTKGAFSELTQGNIYSLVIIPELGKKVTVVVGANKAADAAGNGNIASNIVEVSTGSPASEFDKYREDIQQVIVDEASRSLRSSIAANRRLTQSARNRFVELRQTKVREEEVARALIPFDVDGNFTLSESGLSTAGNFFQQVGNEEGTYRRLFFGDFDVQHDADTDSTTATLTGRVAWEQMTSEQTMLGYFIGGELATSTIGGSFGGDQDRIGVTAGGYVVHELAEQVYFDGFASVGAGRNNLEMANDTLALESEYTTQTATLGGAITGVYSQKGYDFKPELAFSYGKTWLGDIGFTGPAYGLVDNTLSLVADYVSIASLTFRPEVIVPIGADFVADSNTQFTYAPRLVCEQIKTTTTTSDCGTGGELGLTSTSRDGMSNAEFRVIVDKVGDSTRSSLMLNFERQF